ncbi:LOW QUALITY PROTEIN: hypothetical protein CRUP_006158 [Coryphaenoides rupestris]|nr:LOW QUALITY PROTEIN: hypothetical protein CRUP_006158 [Coryphaenoides rupestris]
MSVQCDSEDNETERSETFGKRDAESRVGSRSDARMQVKKHRDSDRSGGAGGAAGGAAGAGAGGDDGRDGPRRKPTSCFSNIKIFLISECALMLAQGTVGAYLVSVLTTLERRFNLQSADVGVIASSFEIGNLALILFVSYFGAKAHRPRLIGCGGIVMALGALLSALPEFLTNQYEIVETLSSDTGRDVCLNTSRQEAQLVEDKLCANKANTNMMYLLLIGAQVLLGELLLYSPLGVSYIDDHVKKKDSSLYIGTNVLTQTTDLATWESSHMTSERPIRRSCACCQPGTSQRPYKTMVLFADKREGRRG